MDSRHGSPPRNRSRPRATPSSPEVSLLALHERLIGGDEAALNEAAERLLRLLQRALHRAFPRAPADWITDAAEDAILDYVRHPGQFDPRRQVWLERFLLPPAVRNLVNRAERERRLKHREEVYAAQAKPGALWGRSPLSDPEEDAQFRVLVLAAAADDAEREALVLLLDGVCDTPALAKALGATDRPVAEQRQEVKRFRDRLIKRVRRASGFRASLRSNFACGRGDR
jgi:hypothetical protein